MLGPSKPTPGAPNSTRPHPFLLLSLQLGCMGSSLARNKTVKENSAHNGVSVTDDQQPYYQATLHWRSLIGARNFLASFPPTKVMNKVDG